MCADTPWPWCRLHSLRVKARSVNSNLFGGVAFEYSFPRLHRNMIFDTLHCVRSVSELGCRAIDRIIHQLLTISGIHTNGISMFNQSLQTPISSCCGTQPYICSRDGDVCLSWPCLTMWMLCNTRGATIFSTVFNLKPLIQIHRFSVQLQWAELFLAVALLMPVNISWDSNGSAQSEPPTD